MWLLIGAGAVIVGCLGLVLVGAFSDDRIDL